MRRVTARLPRRALRRRVQLADPDDAAVQRQDAVDAEPQPFDVVDECERDDTLGYTKPLKALPSGADRARSAALVPRLGVSRMSLAVQHARSMRSTVLAEVDSVRDRRSSPVEADAAPERSHANSRHALLDAVAGAVQALPGGADAADAQPSSKQALHAFVHALFAELRPSSGEGGHGRGFAWGRTSAATLAQRVDDLVARLRAGSSDGATTPAPAADGSDDASTAAAATPSASAPAAASPLLTAFRELATARGADGDGGAASSALIAMLERVASALGGGVEAPPPAAGVLLDATA